MKRILSGWLLVLFLGHYASVTLFPHTHVFNGVRITHSHPFSQAPDTGRHTHTSATFELIAQLSLLVMLAVTFNCFARLVVRVYKQYGERVVDPGSGRIPATLCLRGPPVSF